MLTMLFLLPFIYKFKTHYLHYAMGAAVAIYVLTINFIIKDLHDRIRELTMKIMSLQEVQLYILSALAITVLYTASWLLSILIYNWKVFLGMEENRNESE